VVSGLFQHGTGWHISARSALRPWGDYIPVVPGDPPRASSAAFNRAGGPNRICSQSARVRGVGVNIGYDWQERAFVYGRFEAICSIPTFTRTEDVVGGASGSANFPAHAHSASIGSPTIPPGASASRFPPTAFPLVYATWRTGPWPTGQRPPSNSPPRCRTTVPACIGANSRCLCVAAKSDSCTQVPADRGAGVNTRCGELSVGAEYLFS